MPTAVKISDELIAQARITSKIFRPLNSFHLDPEILSMMEFGL